MQKMDLSFIKNTYKANVGTLRGVLSKTFENNPYICDSYNISPTYYLFTGRKGLWVNNGQNENCIIISVHPNKENSLLLFSINKQNSDTPDFTHIEDVSYKILSKYPNVELRLSRVNKNLDLSRAESFIPVEEELLDWKYPIHILDTKAVYNLKGKSFQQVRQRINQLDVKKCQASRIDIKSDFLNLMNVGREWADDFNHDGYSHNDLIDPSQTLFEMMNNEKLNLYGQKISYDGKIKSFCIWEKSSDIANEFAISVDKKIPGLSEYQMYQMCASLHSDGISLLNVGGSETEGLDRFKKKFAPIISHNLQTYILKLR